MEKTNLYLADLLCDINRVSAVCERASTECPLWRMLVEQKGADWVLCQAPRRITIYANRFYGPATHIYVDMKQCCVPCAEQYQKEILRAEIAAECKLRQVQK